MRRGGFLWIKEKSKMEAAGFLPWGLGSIIQAGVWEGMGDLKEAEHSSSKVFILSEWVLVNCFSACSFMDICQCMFFYRFSLWKFLSSDAMVCFTLLYSGFQNSCRSKLKCSQHVFSFSLVVKSFKITC